MNGMHLKLYFVHRVAHKITQHVIQIFDGLRQLQEVRGRSEPRTVHQFKDSATGR